uniref:BZIP domain-containing protein n=1 Tax=Kalanchoe fedtschenkoi TaxID=63787 RepID=A0A7N0T526_KALFE
MEKFEGSSNFKNLNHSGKTPLLPPKSPFPGGPTSFSGYSSSSGSGSRSFQMHDDGTRHQRTSSESVVIDDQPSWLADLLDEPDTPVRKGGHRRSSSDSFAYLDTGVASSCSFTAWDVYKFKNLMSVSSWGNKEQNVYRDPGHGSFQGENNLCGRRGNHARASSLNSAARPISISPGDKSLSQNLGMSARGTDVPRTTIAGKQDARESGTNDKKAVDGWESYGPKPSASETDAQRAKQQFAQRSRVRKLQYIAELERNVQALQVEGSEVSAELEFANQTNLILSMENKALKQRLDSLAQEHLIKYMEQEVLEREIGRLRNIYQQQPYLHQAAQPHPSSSHRRNNSRDLDSQLANLSLNKEANPSKAIL